MDAGRRRTQAFPYDDPIADAVTCHGGTEDAGSGAGIDSKVRPERITRRGMSRHGQYGCGECGNESSAQERKGCPDRHVALPDVAHGADRSEEHTSELQSLMRISYAVFCLKKKTKTSTKQ